MDDLIDPIVSPGWLLQQLRRDAGGMRLRILDASWRLPGSSEKPALAAHAERRLPGAVFFDLEAISDDASMFPHMAPPAEKFDFKIAELGIARDDRIIVYDDAGLFSAARVWWTFRLMGYRRTSVLDGGLPGWIALGGHTEAGDQAEQVIEAEGASKLARRASQQQGEPPAAFNPATAEDVRAALSNPVIRILDARPAARFTGAAPEPRPGLRRGAMPGAVNIPFSAVLDDQKRMLPDARLREIFSAAGVGPTTPVIATCGSGITAAILILALEKLGHSRHALYDGSWAQWGLEVNDPNLFPVISRSELGDGRQD